MRLKLLSEGAKELSYEIREIVKKANQLQALGLSIHWENIGDPIEKKCQVASHGEKFEVGRPFRTSP